MLQMAVLLLACSSNLLLHTSVHQRQDRLNEVLMITIPLLQPLW